VGLNDGFEDGCAGVMTIKVDRFLSDEDATLGTICIDGVCTSSRRLVRRRVHPVGFGVAVDRSLDTGRGDNDR